MYHDNWNAILEPYGIKYDDKIGEVIQNVGSLLYLAWEMGAELPYSFIYREIMQGHKNFTERQVWALIAAGRLLQLNDAYIVRQEFLQEAKCVEDAYYNIVAKQVRTKQALGSLWLADSRQGLLEPYGIQLLPEIREALAFAERIIGAAEYKTTYHTLRKKFITLPEPVLPVLIAAARLGKLDERYVRDERHFYEAKAVLDALVKHIRACLADGKME